MKGLTMSNDQFVVCGSRLKLHLIADEKHAINN